MSQKKLKESNFSHRKVNLGLNIDHVATLRNARKEKNPSPIAFALLAQICNTDSITIHLREDERHIQEADLKYLKKYLDIPLNLEVSLAEPSIQQALKYLPNSVCLVPENRQEVTTEGGLNLEKNFNKILDSIQTLKEKNIKVSLFINPNPNDVELAKKLNADSVEINTGRYSQSFNNEIQNNELQKIRETAKVCQDLTINCHAGHGLNYQNVVKIASIPNIKELNIGHSIISYSITVGLKLALKKMILLINKPSIN